MDHAFNFWLGVVVISTIGVLAHFLYEWTKQNKIVGLFAAVNESTWEHIKIALTPTLLWALYDGFAYGYDPNYFLAKLISVLSLVFFIPIVFYAYRAITKRSILFIDICIFYVSIVISQLIFYVLVTLPAQPYVVNYLSCLGLFVVFGCYMTLTLKPLKNFLFKDPINGKYGFRAQSKLDKSPEKSKNHNPKK